MTLKYLLNKLMDKVGLSKFNVKIDFSDEDIEYIIEDYAREPGVRGLEKKTQVLLEKIAFDFIERTEKLDEYKKDGEKKEEEKKEDEVADEEEQKEEKVEEERQIKEEEIVITKELIKQYLGPKIFGKQFILHEKEDLIGFAMGLGYNAYGGSVLSIELIELPDKLETQKPEESLTINPTNNETEGSLTLTGSLGDVMKESVEIAYSFAKLFLHKLDYNNTYLDSKHIHMHFPSGASKKDGPSAGITIVTALVSIATNKPYNTEFAMTGEVSLNGKVMKIGGLREKVLAAKREGVKQIICPYSNKADVDEFKDYIKEGMTFHFVRTYDEIYDLLFK